MKRTTPNQVNWREQLDFFPYTWREECETQASHWVRIHNLIPKHGACYSSIIGSATPKPVEKQNKYSGDMLKLLRAANLMFGEGTEYAIAKRERDNKLFEELKQEAKEAGERELLARIRNHERAKLRRKMQEEQE